MGDLECGFEEMQGVRLGYLLIKGKQMFALSQVFTDLLKNIPRTTVHKRMDHLNVKKHQCDLEELRKLKAIHSIAFHAAKCTLISREDVEALYFSCKTERVLKSNKRKANVGLLEDYGKDKLQTGSHPAGIWKEKVWLSLHSVPQTISLKNKPGKREQPNSVPDSNLPHIYNKSLGQDYSSVTKSACKPFKNYETAKIPGNCIAFTQRQSFFRSMVNRQPMLFQSAIAAQSRLSAAGDLLHKRKRRREGGGSGRDRDSSSARHSWSRSRHTHSHTLSPTHQPVLFVQPKCCSKPKTHHNHNRTILGGFHIGHEFYLDHRNHHHPQPQQHGGDFPETYSSDTESSCYSERLHNDSDFGSSLSTSSNSGTSEEEYEEDSSEVSSDEECSSHSDTSSMSSQVSVQSIRFRRARFSSLNTAKKYISRTNAKTLPTALPSNKTQSNCRTLSNSRTLSHTKAPLLLQPTFQYSHQQPSRSMGQGGTCQVDYVSPRKQPKYDFTSREAKQNPHTLSTSVVWGSCFVERRDSRNIPELQIHTQREVNRAESMSRTVSALSPSTNPNGNKAVTQHRTPGHANKCPPGLSSHCAHDKDTKHPKAIDQNQLASNLKREVRISPSLKLPSPLKTIKIEPEEHSVAAGPFPDSSRPVKTHPFNLQNVKIKVEESYDEYEYYSQASGFHCKEDEAVINNGQYPGGDIKHAAGCFNNKTKAIESSARAPKSSSDLQDCGSTQDTRCTEGEYKNGARVRKNDKILLGKKLGIVRAQPKQNVSKVERAFSSRPADKAEICEGNTEDLTGTSKRKRGSNATACLKRSFSFIANFPAPPSLVVGSDGDLSPAYTLNSLGGPRPPPCSHPVWRWQPGGVPVPPPTAHRNRKS